MSKNILNSKIVTHLDPPKRWMSSCGWAVALQPESVVFDFGISGYRKIL